jgi:hypothetical protein
MDEYLTDLLSQTGAVQTGDQDVLRQLKSDLSERVTALINRRLIDALSEDKVAELERLLDEQPDNVEAYQQFMVDNLPNRQEIVNTSLLEFRALYLGVDA